mmetsp:Transcript_13793/g.22770  ORF Transcript_13793/g.22770 Transcript_13793/m.22770 type:complete len:94 (-) Transcript_13793:556-837(-)
MSHVHKRASAQDIYQISALCTQPLCILSFPPMQTALSSDANMERGVSPSFSALPPSYPCFRNDNNSIKSQAKTANKYWSPDFNLFVSVPSLSL